MLPLRVAIRFLRRSPVQSVLIVLGIGVGISTQIFVGSIIQSLQANLIQQTIGTGPQITISAVKNGDPVSYTGELNHIIATDPRIKPGAVATVRVATALWTNGSDSAPLNVIGTTVEGANGIYRLKDNLKSGRVSLGPTDIVIGKDFADKHGVKVGDPVNLTLLGTTGTFSCVGIYDLGTGAFNERNAFVSGSAVQGLLGWTNDQYSAIYVQVVKPFDATNVALQWRTSIGNKVDVVDWQTQNANLLAALTSQSVSSYMIQTFVMIAVALGIASTLAISAVQKTRQIGILKAMGLADRPSGLVFLYEAVILGALGSLTGVGLAYLFLAAFAFAPTPFVVSANPAFVALSASIGVGVALLSAIVPIRRTSSLDPIEVIQGA